MRRSLGLLACSSYKNGWCSFQCYRKEHSGVIVPLTVINSTVGRTRYPVTTTAKLMYMYVVDYIRIMIRNHYNDYNDHYMIRIDL